MVPAPRPRTAEWLEDAYDQDEEENLRQRRQRQQEEVPGGRPLDFDLGLSKEAEGVAQHSGLDGETSIRDPVDVRRPVTLVANASQCPSKTKTRSVRA